MKNNQWITVTSSSLISGYKYDGVGNFDVEFKSNKAMYRYFDVMPFLVNSLDTENIGKEIKTKIIGGGFKYKRLY